MREKNYCINCKKEICYRSKRCYKCEGIQRSRKMRGKGKNKSNFNYIDGRTLKKYYCICGKEIQWRQAIYGSGKCHSCANKGKNNGRYIDGKNCLDNIKYCGCGKKISNMSTYCASCAKKRKRNPAYIHGKGRAPYPLKFNNKLKEQIRKRDNYVCQKCGITEKEHIILYKSILQIHHIDYNKRNCKKENLIALCRQCNLQVNYNRHLWKRYFGGIIKNDYKITI